MAGPVTEENPGATRAPAPGREAGQAGRTGVDGASGDSQAIPAHVGRGGCSIVV
ncbi:MAG TPA: hypothetical protein VFN50_07780 [Acidimicrobiales bacterium]|nr:hypothetical protein [Acidimicrobiales bacterium]